MRAVLKLLALVQQQLRQVGAVLAGDAGDQGGFGHGPLKNQTTLNHGAKTYHISKKLFAIHLLHNLS
jgi:hypothetical protein